MESRAILRQHQTAATPFIWLLAAAACLDAPVAIDPAIDGQMDRTADVADSIMIEEVVKHRISFTFTPETPLVPNAPVALRIVGEVHEAIDGGTVTLTLPTQAAMAHAGPDRPLYYPQAVAHPAAAQWELPRMQAGDTWERTFTVPAAGAGYYLAALFADTHGPPSPMGPFMTDDVYYQTWMAIAEEDGRLTDFFDRAVFPEGVLPEQGPFMTEADVRASAAAADDDDWSGRARKAKPRGSFYVNVVYNHGRRLGLQPAVGARIWAKLSNDRDKITRTVPASGIVDFPCASRPWYRWGKAYLPDTRYVDGASGNFVYHWKADRESCGDTITVQGVREKYMPWRHLHLAAIRINYHFGYSRERVHWKTDLFNDKSYYYSFLWLNKIVLGRRGYDNPWVASHEYTHALHDKSLGGMWGTGNCNPHYIDSISSYTCALSEGLADYGGTIGSNGEGTWRDWETYDDGEPGTKGKIEGYIAALFHDLIDGDNEVDDETSLYSRYVIKTFKTCRVKIGSWKKRTTVADFVWCLENRVNTAVHRKHFPGLLPPSAVSEGATEPSDWNANDIRSTWLLNLSGG